MAASSKDLKRLLRVQQAIKAMREREHAEAEGRSAAVRRDLEELSSLMENAGPVVRLFPDLLSRHFQEKARRKSEAEEEARQTGSAFLRELQKFERMEERYTAQKSADDRVSEEAAQSENLDQSASRGLPASSKFGKLR